MDSRKYLIRTFGCQMNVHDSERLAGLLEADGMVPTDDAEQADVVVLNTCCIRENADNKLYGHLGHLKSLKDRHPGMQIAVAGCLAQKDGEAVAARAPHVDAVFGTHNVGRAVDLLKAAAADPGAGTITEILESSTPEEVDAAFASALPVRRDLPYAAWVTIQVGCDNSCAFCIVPAVRGAEISRRPEQILAEVEGLAAAGTVEVTLLGQNVNSYGRDITRRRPLFADLLTSVAAVQGISRVRFTSPHPKDLRPETIEAMATNKAVCEHLHLPMQSGSDRILAAMHRGYTAQRYLDRLAAARAAIDDLAVSTDVIVGFPGETDDDFARTMEVVAEAQFDSAYTFVFSPRAGTEAAGMADRFVTADVVADRFERLHQVLERSALARHEARIGGVEEVLVEGPSKRDPAMATGRTRQNKLVHFPADPVPAVGSFATVRVDGAAPHHLRGRLVAVTQAPRHRTRIPVAAL